MKPSQRMPPVTEPQIAAISIATVGLVGQFVPLNPEAQQGIVQLSTVTVGALLAADFGVRSARLKHGSWLFEDKDKDPSTPPTLRGGFYWALGGLIFVAVAELIVILWLLLG
jgi:hypothetical protein